MATKTKSDLAATFLIGLDVGFGVVKAQSSNEQAAAFPSVFGSSRSIKFRADDLKAKYRGDQITDDDGAWFIGELALSQIPAGELLRLRGRTADEEAFGNIYRIRLAKAALGKLFPNIHNRDILNLKIATGLPVAYMHDAPALKAALMGQHLIKTDQTEFIANVLDVYVMPQPYGCIYANTLTETGEVNECHDAETTGVLDVGTYTIDLALDDRGEYIDKSSDSREGGVYVAQNHIERVLLSDLGEMPTYRDIETVLRTGCLRVSGKPRDYTDAVEQAIRPVINSTLSFINEKWRSAKRIDVIYLCGGGAYFVYEAVSEIYKDVVLVENAQFANTRGYLNYAILSEGS